MDIAKQEEFTPQKPKEVTYAFYLALGSVGISVLGYIVNTALVWQERFSSRPEFAILWGLTFLLPLWIAFKINAGRNWARWAFAIFTIFDLFDTLNLLRSFSDYPIQSVFYVLSLALSLLAIIILFRSPADAWFKTASVSKSDSEVSLEAVESADKSPKKAGIIGFLTNKEEAPSTAAFIQDWQKLNNLRRVIWVLRIVLFLAIIGTLFLPWYETDIGGPGSGWILGLNLAGWSCGALFIPYIALLLFGVWSILRPGGQMIWAYRASLLLWLAFIGLFGVGLNSNYMGPTLSLTVTIIALIVEAIDFVIVQMNRSNPKGD